VPTEIERLYREHRAGLVRLVERELLDHHEAEDVVQTAFLDAQRALTRGTVPRNPRAWLSAIALNAARRLRRRRLNAEPLEEYAVQEASGMSDLRSALASLPKGQRAAVLYRDLLGLSYGETADQMGTTVSAVTMLLHRGRQRLRQTLGVTTAGVGLWRWLKRAGMPQVAAAKGAAAVVVAAGLATAGIVAARMVAPIGSDATAAVAPRSGSLAARTPRAPDAGPATKSVRHFSRSVDSTRPGVVPAASTAAPIPPLMAPSALRLPTSSLPTLPIPQLPATVAATVSTPIVTATVTAPLGTTATVTTPVVTVTLPVP